MLQIYQKITLKYNIFYYINNCEIEKSIKLRIW